MLSSITWTDYITVILLLVATYYLIIGIRFYAFDIKRIVLGMIKSDINKVFENHQFYKEQIPEKDPAQLELPFGDSTENTLEQVEKLFNDIKEAIEQAVQKRCLREELIYLLSHILKDYQGLKRSSFQSAINELISSECEKLGFPNLNEDEMLKMWG